MNIVNIYDKVIYAIIKDSCYNENLMNFLSIPYECQKCSVVNRCGGGCRSLRYNQKYHEIIS
ncbi:MAG: SPASM domain-containing protein [Candidatus Omnitrophica bacterium]|nr:SPASM domain-containing protein [Candidatus Omnitrophota bacterium]